MFRSKVMSPSSGWLNRFTRILTWYRGHEAAITLSSWEACKQRMSASLILDLSYGNCVTIARIVLTLTGFLSWLRTSLCSYQGAVLHVAIWPWGGGQRGDASHALSCPITVNHKKPQSKQQKSARHNSLCRLNAFLWAALPNLLTCSSLQLKPDASLVCHHSKQTHLTLWN